MAQHNVILKDGRKAIIETRSADVTSTSAGKCPLPPAVSINARLATSVWSAGRHPNLIMASIEGAPFNLIHKRLIAPSRIPRHIGTFGLLLNASV